MFSRLQSEKPPFAVVMLDIDCFKEINDRFGHQAGDSVMQLVARTLTGSLRGTDLVGRYGGDEFTAILPNTDKEGALVIARSMIDAVEKMKMAHPESETAGHVTISVGGATHRSSMGESSVRKMLHVADTALYRSKQAGRNTAVMMEGGSFIN